MRRRGGLVRPKRSTIMPANAGFAGTTLLVTVLLTGCGDGADRDGSDTSDLASAADTHAAFMANLAVHCGGHFPGRLTLAPEGDTMLTGTELLLVHFLECDADEVRIPFHIETGAGNGGDRSRTWHVIRHDDRLELRHDHREPDGAESTRTWYGGFTESDGTATHQDFVSPERTAAAGSPVGWRIEIEPGVRYVYGTTRDGEYTWRIEFDLSRPHTEPVPPRWGHDRDPSRIPGPP
jgi:hypothetical protein